MPELGVVSWGDVEPGRLVLLDGSWARAAEAEPPRADGFRAVSFLRPESGSRAVRYVRQAGYQVTVSMEIEEAA
jgi:hypothetical protein